MRWASWVNFVLGIWLIVSPIALRYSHVPAALPNDLLVGIVIAALSLWMAAMYEPPALVSWIVTLLGVWMIFASLVLRYSGQSRAAMADEMAIGVIVFVLALVRALGIGQRIRQSR